MNIARLKETMPEDQYNKLPKAKKALMEALIEFEAEHRGKTVMADMYKLGRRNGNIFAADLKTLERRNMPIECEEFVKHNWHWESTGIVYDLKKEETEKMRAERIQTREQRREQEKLQAETGRVFTQALKTVGQTAAANIAEQKVADKVPATVDSVLADYVKNNGHQFKELAEAEKAYVENENFKLFIDNLVQEGNK